MSNENKIVLDNDELPLVAESEKKIEEDATLALKLLKRTDNLDLAEALGLSIYIQGAA